MLHASSFFSSVPVTLGTLEDRENGASKDVGVPADESHAGTGTAKVPVVPTSSPSDTTDWAHYDKLSVLAVQIGAKAQCV